MTHYSIINSIINYNFENINSLITKKTGRDGQKRISDLESAHQI